MNVWVVLGFLGVQIICAMSLKTTECVAVMEVCVAQSTLCRSAWELLRSVCEAKDGSCSIMGTKYCNATVQYMLERFPLWAGCLCIEEKYCSIPYLLNPQCITESGVELLHPGPTPNWSVGQMDMELWQPEGLKHCLSALEDCRGSPHCWSAYRVLRGSPGSTCLAWEHLRSTTLANCTCSPVAQKGAKKCLRVWNLLNKDPCVRDVLEPLVLQTAPDQTYWEQEFYNMAESQQNSKTEWRSSPLLDKVPKTQGSCLSEMKVCIRDTVCNTQLSALIKSCSEPGCNGARCQRATRRFYDGLPFSVAEMLVFCGCEPEDRQCLSARADFQSPMCPGHLDTASTCLDAHDDCVKSPICRKRYETFQAKCSGFEGILCHTTESCFSPIDPEFILGSDFECRKAFVGTMGTVLHQPCTCERLNSDNRRKCNFFRSIFHDKSSFILGQNKGNTSHEAVHVESTKVGLQWINYKGVFVVGCIIITAFMLMAIIVVLQKCGICQKKKPRFHSTTQCM